MDAHHIRHWADGGETSLDNTMLLCGGHHRLVHEGGYDLRKDHRGRWYFMRPDGRAIPRYGYQPDDLVDEGLGDGLDIDRGGDSAEAPGGWRVTPHSTGVREAAASYAIAR